MTTDINSSVPAFRLGFAPFTGRDSNGQQSVGYPVEIGAAFHRKDREKGLVAKFAFLPANFKDGILLLMPVRQETDTASRTDDEAQASSPRRAKARK